MLCEACPRSGPGHSTQPQPQQSPRPCDVQVGTQDGRVKLIGRPGVEVSLRSSSRSPTKYLGFLKNKGAVLRVTQVGSRREAGSLVP
jgi:hypothetical protein